MAPRPLNILTWHVHGSYLYYLLHTPHNFFIPVKPGRPESYGGLPEGTSYTWPANAHEIPAEEVQNLDLDVILFQSRRNYLEDQHEILTPAQRELPRVYLEHDPPREVPTDTCHIVDDPNTLLVHVTHFNELMWDNGRTPTRVIEHGVVVPDEVRYTGELPRGIVVVNGLSQRGRRLGVDLFERARLRVPLDLVGMQADELNGVGEVSHDRLLAFESRYRFFFNPIRYTSLGLAVCEAMMIGMPIVGMATTEMVTVVEDGISGYLDTNPDRLIDCMNGLVGDVALAHQMGARAQLVALERFNIQRFAQDWDAVLREVAGNQRTEQTIPQANQTAETLLVEAGER